ncbi:cytochrome P450 76AD1-like [Beta vulgaris subsp. vulgaris]|uniref:cytochrome P450 76AD1-like n=1 Tax=Beta vulgaris subsp. vulgaris TaxID=3555 RepID=UPI00203675F9|nr:cytochrome P450 76AD1-like [Beta vulgaris subsp. vulgaris]
MDEVLGKDGKMQESDIAKLPYVQSILKEVMRLYPPAPFLIPHKAEQDVPLGGYLVPKNSTIWVNVYSIGHDPRVWQDPEIFSPERFLETNVDFKGQDFELLPFGSGRRICPGIPLAHRMVQMMLGVLLHSFNWKYAHGTNPKDIDMEEKFGIALQKAEPLQAIPLPR